LVFRSVCTIFVIKITNKAMSNKEPGYVYILTNPSFREDWVKIGKSSRSTIEHLGVWEQLHNPSFNPIEFDGIRQQAGLNAFSLIPKEMG